MKRLVVILLVLIALGLLFAGRIADRLIIFPSTSPIDARGAVREKIAFEKHDLEAWTARSELARQRGGPNLFVLRFYGNADRAERWVALEAEAWDRRAVEVWGVNYPGFGGSSGPARLDSVPGAALTAFDRLKQRSGNKPIVLFGASIGTTAALHVAAHRDVAGVVLHNPPPLRQMILRRFGWWNLWLLAGPVAHQIPPELDSIGNARRSRAPAVFLLAQSDEIVPAKYQQLVVDAYAGEKRVVQLTGAHHNSPIEGAIVADVYKAYDWLLPR